MKTNNFQKDLTRKIFKKFGIEDYLASEKVKYKSPIRPIRLK